MRAMGFQAGGHVRWAMLMHRGARSAVVLNGWLLEPFPLRGGLMQGSGASPLYWAIVLQPLVAHVNSLGTLARIRLPAGEEAEPLGCFADDCSTALPGGAARFEAQLAPLTDAYDLFEAGSGVALSKPKSEVAGTVDPDGSYAALVKKWFPAK